MEASLLMWGVGASLAAGLATALGALPMLWLRQPQVDQQRVLLGFAAGVMLAASFFSLIIPGIEQAQAGGASRVEAAAIVVAAVLLGAAVIARLNALVPPLDNWGPGSGLFGLSGLGTGAIAAASQRQVWLFVAAIALHNLPEGLAVGVSYGTGDITAGTATAVAIGTQNIPEGLAVAATLAVAGYSRRVAFTTALLSGLVEPVGGLIGVSLVVASAALLPWGLGFAAGAMIYVVATDIIPQVHGRLGSSRPATGLMIGLASMMFLDVAFG